MAAPELLTAQDLVDLATFYAHSSAEERDLRLVRHAVQEAYRELAHERDWNYYIRQARIHLSASQSSSTITYTSSTRALTLASGTWPSWAANGTVRIAGVNHKVSTRDSNTQLTLDPVNCPAADIAAGTSYVLFRTVYPLPPDFKRLLRPTTVDGAWQNYVCPESWLSLERRSYTTGGPTQWTVLGDENTLAGNAIHIWPAPTSTETLDFLYHRTPRQLVYTGYDGNQNSQRTTTQSTVATTADSATVTGTNTAFAAAHVGSIIRVTDSTSVLPDGRDGGLNPWLEQKVISARASATSLTADSVFSNTLSGVFYTISDPVDVAPSMLNALKACLRWKVAELRRMDSAERDYIAYARARVLAFENDARVDIERYASGPWWGGAWEEVGDVDMTYTD